MKLFDFFKNKSGSTPTNAQSPQNSPRSEFDFLFKYAEYLIIHIRN